MTSNIESFSKIAKFYSDEFEEESPFNSYYERPRMIKLIDNIENECVLDAGCAGGWYSEKLLQKGAKVTSIDINEKMLELAKKRIFDKKLNDNSKILFQDLNQKLSFKKDSFDMILSSLTIHYIKNLENVLKEFQRILKPNSPLLFSTHHPFMNFKRINNNDYFNQHIKAETWKKGDQNPISVKIKFYHRSFEKIINTTCKYFNIEKIIEPKPIKEFKNKDELNYQYLNKNPHFLIIKGFNKKNNF